MWLTGARPTTRPAEADVDGQPERGMPCACSGAECTECAPPAGNGSQRSLELRHGRCLPKCIMPAPHEILAGLQRIANEAVAVAIAWHVVFWVVVVVLALGWRPSARTVGVALVFPLASVGAIAWAFGNPFNGTVFVVAALALGAVALRAPASTAAFGAPWARALGAALVAFGLVYPHFLEARSALVYLYAAATGTIPCPTLALVVGVTLASGGLLGNGWRLGIAALAAFYAVFGTLRLGVWVDLVLLAGSVGLFAQHAFERRPPVHSTAMRGSASTSSRA